MLETKSPPTARALDVIEYLARAGADPVRLTDVVRDLGLNHATGTNILSTLCDRGWASRDTLDKSFTLGPALAVAALQGESARPLAHAVREAAVRLAESTGFAASVTERVRDTLLISSFTGGQDSRLNRVQGDRLPYAAPFGPAFAAWEADGGKAWVSGASSANVQLEAPLTEVLQLTRERGFSIERLTPTLNGLLRLIGRIRADDLEGPLRHLINEMLSEITSTSLLSERTHSQPISAIAAPVMDDRGVVVFNLSLHPLRTLSATELMRSTEALGEAVANIGA